MAGYLGVEPRTCELTVHRSATELIPNDILYDFFLGALACRFLYNFVIMIRANTAIVATVNFAMTLISYTVWFHKNGCLGRIRTYVRLLHPSFA